MSQRGSRAARSGAWAPPAAPPARRPRGRRATCDARSTRQPPRSSASSARSSGNRTPTSASVSKDGLLEPLHVGGAQHPPAQARPDGVDPCASLRHRSSSSPRPMLPARRAASSGRRRRRPRRCERRLGTQNAAPPVRGRGGEAPSRLAAPSGPTAVAGLRALSSPGGRGVSPAGPGASGISGRAVSARLSSLSAAPGAPCMSARPAPQRRPARATPGRPRGCRAPWRARGSFSGRMCRRKRLVRSSLGWKKTSLGGPCSMK